MRFALTLLALAFGYVLGLWASAGVLAEGTGVHLTGRVSAIAEEAEEGRFQIIGDYGSLTIDVSAWDYMIDYLRAENGKEITVTLEPK